MKEKEREKGRNRDREGEDKRKRERGKKCVMKRGREKKRQWMIREQIR